MYGISDMQINCFRIKVRNSEGNLGLRKEKERNS